MMTFRIGTVAALVAALGCTSVATGPGAARARPAPAPTEPHVRTAEEAGGTLTARNGRLRRGCHRYGYRYSVYSPYGDWMLELKVVDPRGKAVHAMTFMSIRGPEAGPVRYTLCRRGTRPGKFRVRGKLTWYDDPSVPNVVNLPPAVFRLRKPRPR